MVFFYMTWSTLVLSHSALRVELFGTLAARLVFFLIPSLLFFTFDIAAPGTAVLLKEHGKHGLPTGSTRGKLTRKEMTIAGISLVNLALGIATQFLLEAFLIKTPRLRPAVQVTMSVPMPWDIAWDLLLGFLGREVSTYYSLINNQRDVKN